MNRLLQAVTDITTENYVGMFGLDFDKKYKIKIFNEVCIHGLFHPVVASMQRGLGEDLQ